MRDHLKSKQEGQSVSLIPWIVALSVVLLMSVGPGVLLVNRPETVLGLPLIYAWALFWYLVICVIAWRMDRLFWRKDRLEEEPAGERGNE